MVAEALHLGKQDLEIVVVQVAVVVEMLELVELEILPQFLYLKEITVDQVHHVDLEDL